MRATVVSSLVLAVAWLLGNAPAARADMRSGEAKFLHGDYQEAIVAFQKVKGKDAARAQVRLGRVYLATGDHAAAEKAASAASRARDRAVADDARVLLAEVHRATGRYADARKVLQEVVRRSPRHLRARCQLGLVLHETGAIEEAKKIWNAFYDDHEAGRIEDGSAEQLVYLATAARYLEDFHGASDTLQDAVAKDPNHLEANLQWGWLFLEKYNAGDAETSFDEVLKIDPNHADAHAGMARVKLEQAYDVRGAEGHLDKALATNPRHARALSVRAELQIDNGEYAAARQTLARALAVNPNDVVAHTLIATIAWLADDNAGYEAARRKVFAMNPRYAAFYHVVAEFAVKEHRYKEAIRLEEAALKLDPRYHVALAAIGTGYLRMGDERKGLKYLREAYDRDSFNVRTYNILNLFDEAIPTRYQMIAPSKRFRLRVSKDERKQLERYVPRVLDRAFADMVKRYGFTPKTPITIELFDDPDHYSVRTVGLPNLGALGVCFGQVITALSPSNGNVNWGMVLWHELGHVFAIQLSGSRVPRWFTEGLSEYETIIARPEWRRENDADVWQALAANQLPSVVELNTRFLRAKDMNDMVVAYHMSSVTVEFIARRWGFGKIVEALRLFGKGKDTAQVVAAITGLGVPAFDAELRKHLQQRLAPYRGTFAVSLGGYGDLTALEKAAAARPRDAEAQADLALGSLVAEDADRAGAAAAAALKLDPRNKKALFASAEVLLAQGSLAAARARLHKLVAVGGDGYDARLRLGRIAVQEGDLKEAELQLGKAKILDPERSEPYAILAELYTKHGREGDALRELERYVHIEQFEYAPLKKLVTKHALAKRWAKVRDFGEMALFINPYDPDLHLALGGAHLALGAPDAALYEYESALLAAPPLRRPALAQLGLARAYLARKDRPRARRAVQAALKHEPKNAEALELARKAGVAVRPPAAVGGGRKKRR